MLEATAPTNNQKIEVAPRRIQIPVNVLGIARAVVLIPPVEELKEIRTVNSNRISVEEVASEVEQRLRSSFAEEFRKMAEKRSRFSKSTVYLNRLANLSELSGDIVGSNSLLAEAVKLESDPVLMEKLASSFMQLNRPSEAKTLLADIASKGDPRANLRLAHLSVMEGDFTQATKFVDRALEVDPTNFEGHLFAGTMCLVTNQFQFAVRHFRVAEGERSNSAALFVNMAVAQVCLGHIGKALKSLRQAVSINPTSENAVALLADLAFSEKKNELAVGPLDQYVKYEQKKPQMWARLGRAQHAMGMFDEAIKAVKAEAGLRPAISPLNNIGVSYWGKGDLESAAKYFDLALKQDHSTDEHAYLIAIKNYIAVLLKSGKVQDALMRSEKVIEGDVDRNLAKDETLSAFYLQNLDGLTRMERYELVVARSMEILEWSGIAPTLKVGVLSGLVYYFTVISPNNILATGYAKRVLEEIRGGIACTDHAKMMALNNAAYTYIEANQLDDASNILNELSRYVHSDAFPTATLGLFHFRKGHIERGEALYKEAIGLVEEPRMRRRFEQKLNLELGKSYLERGEIGLAKMLLIKASKELGGLKLFSESASTALAKLPVLKGSE